MKKGNFKGFEMFKKLTIFIIITLTIVNLKARVYRFGAITTVDSKILKNRFQPLLDYLSKETGERFIFDTGKDYDETIEKFINGYFDLGYIGPSPYVIAKRIAKDRIKIIAGVETNFTPYFRAVIFTRRDSNLNSIADLKGKEFAFGSYRSTLSFYLPYYMLLQSGVIGSLAGFDFLGRHDVVVKNVIMGKYDAGGVKISVAQKYKRFIKILAESEPVTDFAIVVNSSMDPKLVKKIQEALFKLKDTKILNSIKPNMTGFGVRSDKDYNRVREIMDIVDKDIRKRIGSSLYFDKLLFFATLSPKL